MTEITQRKQDHIDWLLKDQRIERDQSGFDAIQLTHRAMPECDFDRIDTRQSFLGHTLSFPFLISSMTGGASGNLSEINRRLAQAAEQTQTAMAVGSQRALITDPGADTSFQLRQYAPSVPLLANMGAIQLNYGFGADQARRMVDTLQANALILHLNPLQEVIQPEGDRNFSKLAERIGQLNQALDVPVILKEVGCGLSAADIQLGLDAGIEWFDLAGRGGTSWSRIEAHRSGEHTRADLGETFQDWGLTTPQALLEARRFQNQAHFIASGGIRNGIDMVKSVIMGGHVCGTAAPLLQPAMTSTQACVAVIEQFHLAFRTAQFLLGASTVSNLFLNDALLHQNQSCRTE
jgi:isopentenyl-diphosphate delta-isomerase